MPPRGFFGRIRPTAPTRVQPFQRTLPEGLIQEPEVQRGLARFFGLKERFPAPTVAPDVQPVVIVGDTRSRTLQITERSCGGSVNQGPVAGQLSHAVLLPPPVAGLVVHVHRVRVSCSSGPIIRAAFTTVPPILATQGFFQFLDRRLGVNSFPKTDVYGAADVVMLALPAFVTQRSTANTPYDWFFDPPLILAAIPDASGVPIPHALIIGTDVANMSLAVSFEWTEEDTVAAP